MECYDRRNNRLSELGYLNYQDYLKSDDWKQLKNKILLDNEKCWCCLIRKSYTLHHTDYSFETLLGLRLGALIPICEHCHKHIEFDDDGNKLTIHKVNKRMKDLCKVNNVKQFKLPSWTKK